MIDKLESGEVTTFLDVILGMLLLLFTFLTLTITVVAIVATQNGVEAKAEYVITVTWPHELNGDVDTHVQDPRGNRVWYEDKDNGLMNIDRDDVGPEPNNGGQFQYNENREVTTLRGIYSGEYIINLHAYNLAGIEEIPVTVSVQKINPSVILVFNETVTLRKDGEEITVIRFELDAEGSIKSTNKLPIKMVHRWVPRQSS